MKIAMVGPFQEELKEGGVENYVHYLSKSLELLGVEVERWSWKAGSSGNIRKVSLLSLGRCFETDADIVHLHSTAIPFSYISGLGKFHNKCVATIHAFFHPELETGLRMKAISHFLGAAYIKALKKIRNNVAVSNFTREEAELRGVPVKEVIGNGIPLRDLEGISSNDNLRSDVMMAGRLNRQKGIYDFIEAFSGQGIDALLVGYGDKQMEQSIMSLCGKAGIRCIIRPTKKTLFEAVKSCKVFAFPSRHESFGIAGLEALALGKPVVVYTDAGGPLDYIRDGYNGVVIESSASALRAKTEELLDNESLLNTLSLNAKESAKPYNWIEVAKKMKTFYEGLLK